VTAFADALERGALSLSSPTGLLQSSVGVPHVRLRLYRDVLLAASNSRELVLALRAATASFARTAAAQAQVEVAWTYPGRARPGLRTTGGVAREIVESSRLSLLIVGYSVTVDEAMSGLAAQTIAAIARAAERGVLITAVLHREANYRALVAAWRPGVPQPSTFTWPLRNDEMAAVHAKLLISDRSDALVTSANLTYHGFERNIEMGLRVTGRTAAEMHDRIHELIASGDLVPWR
jgi:cardiolipin synthase